MHKLHNTTFFKKKPTTYTPIVLSVLSGLYGELNMIPDLHMLLQTKCKFGLQKYVDCLLIVADSMIFFNQGLADVHLLIPALMMLF